MGHRPVVSTKEARVRVICVCQQKGGVGKTTTTFHLARAFVRLGRRVLVIGMDMQGNLHTQIALEEVEPDQITIADALSAQEPDVSLADVIVPGLWGVDVAPATSTLATVADELVAAGAGRQRRLAEQLEAVGESYDIVLIDCAPALSILTVNALAAADLAVPVTMPELLSLDGLAELLDTVEEVRASWRPRLRMPGVVVNGLDERVIEDRESMDQLRESGVPILQVIPRRIAIRRAFARALALDELPEGGWPAAELYLETARTLLNEGD